MWLRFLLSHAPSSSLALVEGKWEADMMVVFHSGAQHQKLDIVLSKSGMLVFIGVKIYAISLQAGSDAFY